MDRQSAEKRAKNLVDHMTVEEMVSQLRYDAPAIERLNIPEYNWWNEGLHGVARAGTATVFPQAIGLGATFDEALGKKTADAVATEVRAKYNESVKYGDRDIYKGLTVWSPNVNIFRDPRWGRGHETYGEDPYLTARIGVSFVKGLQGDGEYLKTAACAKHFAVHSGPEALRHSFDAAASLKDLWETYLPAFEACVREAGVEAVMGAYNRTNGEPCCAHNYLMQEVLKKQWKFEGYYVSDCWAIKDFHENHKVTKDAFESVQLALEKGCDLNCGCAYRVLMEAYDRGMLSAETIRKSVITLFTTRFLLGMFDKTEFDQIPYEKVECEEHLQLAETAAKESLVLLKNNGILPLKLDEIKTIGVIGPNADSRRALLGNYHGTPSRHITVLEGIQDYVGDSARVLYAKGCHLNYDREEPLARSGDRLAEAKAVAAHSDLVILCLGLNETLEGEEGDAGNAYASGDKRDLLLPESQRQLLEAVAAAKVPFVVCVMAGSALDLTFAEEHADAILQAWYPGARGGRAIAETVFGASELFGKLPVTFYKNLDTLPEFTDYSMKGRTYRYLEEAPLYSFGYGLTYGKAMVTEAVCNTLTFSKAVQAGTDIQLTLYNQGSHTANEVLQTYIHVNDTPDEVKNTRLAAFMRVSLAPGEEKKVTITVPADAFSTVNELGERRVTGSSADIYVGFGQPDERTKELLGDTGKQLHIENSGV